MALPDSQGLWVQQAMSIGRKTQRRAAFTLVELLVVVAITGLLATMLLPAFKRAREQARRTVCSANLKGLTLSWELYTIEYESAPQLARRGVDVNYDCVTGSPCVREGYPGFGPDTFDDYLSGNSDDQVWISAIYYRHVFFQVANPPPPGPLPGHFWNWGLMWLSRIVDRPEVFFCPSMREADFAWNTPLNPWPPSRETMWRPDEPHLVNHTQASYERRIALTGVPWDRVSGLTTIAHDLGAPHVEQLAHKTGANVARRDGSVSFLRGSQFVEWMNGDDEWNKEITRRRLLEFSYWIDTAGAYPFNPGDGTSR